MASQNVPSPQGTKTSWINDPVIRGYIYQAIVVVCLGLLIWFLVDNTIYNLAKTNKSTGFDFFTQASGFDIQFTLIPYDRSATYFTVFIVGILNTFLVSAIGIVFATMLGFLLGIMRLSSNWIISRLALVYVETLRNIPLLLQLVFWYFAVLNFLPLAQQSLSLFDSAFLNRRGLYLPQPLFGDNFVWVALAAVVAIIAVWALRRWARVRLEKTGNRFPVFWTAIIVLIGVPALTWLISGAQLTFDIPVRRGLNYGGGMALPPELVALALGLILYTAAFIAEIVRAGILAVSHGQTEAAQALGLQDGDRLRLVVIPQAMRVIVPPLTSQYLNLTKNSSLAVAIGYPDLVNVFMNTSGNQTGRYLEIVFLTMLVYLTISLLTSMVMNWYNARVALVER